MMAAFCLNKNLQIWWDGGCIDLFAYHVASVCFICVNDKKIFHKDSELFYGFTL